MHRFYVYHSLTQFHRNSIAAAALFLAAKVEEQPRKLEHVIKVAHMCLHRDAPALDTKSEVRNINKIILFYYICIKIKIKIIFYINILYFCNFVIPGISGTSS